MEPKYRKLFNLYLNDIRRFRLLTEEEERELGKKVLKGDLDASNKLVEHNLKLVIWLAKKYMPIVFRKGMVLSDLVSAGNMGLIYASRSFDYRKKTRFPTYARACIIQKIREALYQNSIVHVPENRQKNSSWMRPRVAEIKRLTGEKDENKIRNHIIYENSIKPVYIDAIKYDGEGKIKDLDYLPWVEDKNSTIFVDNMDKTDIKNCLNKTLKMLDPTDKKILEYLFFKNTNINMKLKIPHKTKNGIPYNRTLREVGKDLGISYERVRQRSDRGLKKLKQILDPNNNKTVETVYD
jgi:RNA polymerase primary sigma factor